jgi:Cu(I)/Ag(I) efflux system membrane fusion protein
MRKRSRGSNLLFLFLALLFIFSCTEKKGSDKAMSENDMYTCPMPEDSVFSDKPGACPKCGMDLIKVEKAIKKEQFICPMFCDSLVFEKPGICPVCKMHLVKVEPHEHSHDHQSDTQGPTSKVFTCPMHPEIIRDKPGQCPVCGMDLVEKIENANTPKSGLGQIVESVNETVLTSIATIKPEQKSIPIVIEAFGYVSYDPQSTHSIASRYSGRIEKLYVKYNFQRVYKGEKIMDIYSPEIVTAQENLVFLLNSDPDNAGLIGAAKEKLKLLGMDDNQISRLVKTKRSENIVTIYAKVDGHLHQMGNHLADITSFIVKNENGMNANEANAEFTIKEGMYIEKGQTIFNVIGTEKMWVILKIFPQDIQFVKKGQPVEIVSEMFPDQIIKDKLAFIEPVFIDGSKYLSARVYLEGGDHQHSKFKIGSFVKSKIAAGDEKGLWIPSQAAIDLGNSEFAVFIKHGEVFKSTKVITGTRIGKMLEIKAGLQSTDEIASDAQYLVDSEGFVKTNQ